MTNMHVHIIKMGGTIEFIDSAYDDFNKKLLKLDVSIESYLRNLVKPHFNFSAETIVEKDSRDITEEDRQRLVKATMNSPNENIIITHGTFSMKDTAQFLENHNFNNKKIILTGSMIPIIGFAASDAGFNIGFAIGLFASLEPGVYLSMNGGIFTADEIEKNKELFRFE